MEHPPFTAQTLITQVMLEMPSSVRLLMDQHAACPGCSMSAYCTLADVCKNHALDLGALLAALNAFSPPPPAPAPMPQPPPRSTPPAG